MSAVSTVTKPGTDFPLPVISYDALQSRDPKEIGLLSKALHEVGAVAVSNVPDFPQQRQAFFTSASAFAALSDAEKDEVRAGGVEKTYSYLGLDNAAEQFRAADGKPYTDTSKQSLYFGYPDFEHNKWPSTTDLRRDSLALARTIHDVGDLVMRSISMVGEGTPIPSLDVGDGEGAAHDVARILQYTPYREDDPNPHWCGQHTDHGLITGLIQARYLRGGAEVPQPAGAGLHIKIDGTYHRVTTAAGNIIYQIGEFGQLLMDDKVVATEHRVDKPSVYDPTLTRQTFALFFDPPLGVKLEGSKSILTKDPRYKDGMAFDEFHLATLESHRYDDDQGSK